jgi:hypothetical protein
VFNAGGEILGNENFYILRRAWEGVNKTQLQGTSFFDKLLGYEP